MSYKRVSILCMLLRRLTNIPGYQWTSIHWTTIFFGNGVFRHKSSSRSYCVKLDMNLLLKHWYTSCWLQITRSSLACIRMRRSTTHSERVWLRQTSLMGELLGRIGSFCRFQLRFRRLWFAHKDWKIIVFTPVSC